MVYRTAPLLAALLVLGGASAAEPAQPYADQPARAMVRRGGLPNVMAKLNAGEPVRIAYFGGSITAQAGWRVFSFEWFGQQWPAAELTQIDATIGGTNSEHGVYRYQQDVLSKDPDLVFVEFAVNDGGGQPNNIFRAMEGIVRQTWAQDPTIDLCFVYTFRTGYENQLREGLNPPAASAHEMLAEWYGIPSVNVALPVVQMAEAGELLYTPVEVDGQRQPVPEGVVLFSDDGVHPHPEGGHRVYMALLAEALDAWRAGDAPGPHVLRDPFIADHWQAAKLVPLRAAMLGGEWRQLPTDGGLGGAFNSRLPEIWATNQPGASLTFSFVGTTAKLYDLLGPDGGQVDITLDGQTRGPVARFDSYCTYWRLANLELARDLEPVRHTVTITLRADQPDRAIVTDRERDKPDFDPAKYDGTNLWVGSIMILGDVVE